MDANFGLVRKHSGGKSRAPPNHDGLYFLPQDVVEHYLDSVPSGFLNENSNVNCCIVFNVKNILECRHCEWLSSCLLGFQVSVEGQHLRYILFQLSCL